MAYSYSPIDPKIAAYITFCIYLSKSQIEQGLAEQNKQKLQPGSLNASLHKAALAAVKAKVQGVIDVVITSDGWTIWRDSNQNILSRIAYGYYIVKNGTRKRAISYTWKEVYMGGGQYGNLEAGKENTLAAIDFD